MSELDTFLDSDADSFLDAQPKSISQPSQKAVDYFGEKTGELGGNFASQAMSSVPLIGRQFMGMLRSKEGPKVDKAKQALSIIEGPGSDKQRIKQLKQLFPAAKFGFSKNDGRFMVVGGKKLQLFEKGSENYPTVPNVIFQGLDNKNIPAEDRPRQLIEFLAGKKQIMGPGNVPVEVLDKKEFNKIKKSVVFGKDVYGNNTVTFKSDARLPKHPYLDPITPSSMKIIPKGTYYLEKPTGLDFSKESIVQGIGTAQREVNDPVNQMTAASGGIGRVPSLLKLAGSTGIGSMIGQAVKEKSKELSGGEYSIGNILRTGRNTAAGTLVGGKAIQWLSGLWRVGQKLTGKAAAKFSDVVDKSGNLKPDFVKQLQTKGMTVDDLSKAINKEMGGKLTPAQQKELSNFMKTTKAFPTKGQATQDPTQLRSEFAGLSKGSMPKVQEQINLQSKGLHQSLDKPINQTGVNPVHGSEALRTQAGEAVTQSLVKNEAARRAGASTIYKAAKEAVGANTNIPRNTFTKSVAKSFNENRAVMNNNFGRELQRRLSEFGILGKGKKPFTVKEAEEFRKWVGQSGKNLANSANVEDRALAHVFNNVKKSLDKAVEKLGHKSKEAGNLFKGGRKAVQTRKNLFESKDAIQKITQGKIAPQDIVKRIESKSIKLPELQKMMKTLKNSKGGTEAINQVRGSMITKVKEAATGGPMAKGVNRFESKKYIDTFDKHKQELKVILEPKQYSFLQKLRKAAEMNLLENPPTGARTRIFQSLSMAAKEAGPIGRAFSKFISSGQRKALSVKRAAGEALKKADKPNAAPSSLVGAESNRRLNNR